MDDTKQINIRISKQLHYDMQYIAEHLKISRNDWLKFKLAELIRDEKQRIMANTELEYLRGTISDQEFKERMGISPPNELKARRDGSNKAAEDYIMGLLEKVK